MEKELTNARKASNALYKSLQENGYQGLPSEESFYNTLQDSTQAAAIYNSLQENGYGGLPSRESFYKTLIEDYGQTPSSTQAGETEQQPAENAPTFEVGGNGYTFTEDELQKMEEGQRPVMKPKYGTPEYGSQKIEGDASNPYAGMTRQQAINAVGKKFFNEWYGKDHTPETTEEVDGEQVKYGGLGAYDQIRAELAANDIVEPENYANVTKDIRRAYIPEVARRRIQQLMGDFESANHWNAEDIRNVLDSREAQQAINQDLERLGFAPTPEAYDGDQQAMHRDIQRYEQARQYYYKQLENELENVLVNKFGWLPSKDYRSGVESFRDELISGGAEEHEERIRDREALNMVTKYATPQVQKYFNEAEEKGREAYRQALNSVPGVSQASAGTYQNNMGNALGAALYAGYAENKETDPGKIWAAMEPNLKQMGAAIVSDPGFISQAEAHAAEEGVELTDYMQRRVLPVLESIYQKEFERIAVENEMPKNFLQYALGKMRESLPGMLINAAFTSQARRRAQQRAMQLTEVGQGKWTPNSYGRIGGGFLGMVPELALYGAAGKLASPVGGAVAQELSGAGLRPLVSRIAGASITGAGTMGGAETVKGFTEGLLNDNDYEHMTDEDDRSFLDVLGGAVKNAVERGVPSTVSGLTMVGGPFGQKISNGRGIIGNLLGWGTQVGIDAAGATAVSVIRGDVKPENAGEDFLESVGLFAALGLQHKAKEFKTLANGGRSWNGVEFTKKDIQTLEDFGLDKLRNQMKDIERARNRKGLIGQSLGLEATKEQVEAAKSEGAKLYNEIMRSYAIPFELKVKVAQAMGAPIPDYAVKPEVLELSARVPAESVDLGLVDMLEYEYNREGGVADKVKQGQELDSNELNLRLLFQENKAFNEAVEKLQRGEELTDEEQSLIVRNQRRLNDVQKQYYRLEHERVNREFEAEHGLEPGTMNRLLRDVAEGKAINEANIMKEYEEYLRGVDQHLGDVRAEVEARKAAEAEAMAEAEKQAVENTESQEGGVPENESINKAEVVTENETTPPPPLVMDEKGEVLWEQSPVEATVAGLTERVGKERVGQIVDEEIASLTDELTSLSERRVKNMNERLQREQDIADVAERMVYWQQVKDAIAPKEEAAKPEEVQKPAEPEAAVVEQKPEEQKPAEAETPVEGEAPAAPDQPVTPPEDADRPAELTAEQKVAQGTVNNNTGKRFGFQNQDGSRSEIVIDGIGEDGKVEVTRQDYDADGRETGDPYKQSLDMVSVGNSIVNGTMKPALTTEEKLRQVHKFDKFKVGDVALLDVLTDAEQRQVLEALERGDTEAVGNMTPDLIREHHEDLILKGRDDRNAKVRSIMEGNGSREQKLRKVRELYKGYEDAEVSLEDATLAPTTLGEYVAYLHSRVPKSGEGPIAYFSYKQGDTEVTGLQDESGYGKKSSGDADAFKPWLAPKGKGMSLMKYAEQIHSQLPEEIQKQFDVNDVRNAILDVFSAAERPSDITTMILKRGVEQAEQAVRRMEDNWIEGGPSYQKVSADDNSFAGRLTRAKEQTNAEPTEKQKAAGNFKKGHVSFGGYDFVVENPEGSVRRGEADGRKWENKMNNTYGYILGKRGKDGDHLDMFINDAQDLDNFDGKVYVIDQVNPKTGEFDEHKIMYGFDSEEAARDAYLSNYEEGWQGLGRITGVDKDTFDKWLDSSDKKIKAFAEHSIIRDALSKPEVKKPVTNAEIDKAFVTELDKEMKNAGVKVADTLEEVEEGQAVLDAFNGETKKMAVDTTTPEYQRKVKEAEERIDKRLDEYRENKKKQNSRPASRIPNQGPTSPQQSGGKGIASSGAKVSKKLYSSKDLAEKMADFIENLPNNNTLTPENFPLQVVRALQVPEQQGRNSQYANVVSDDGNTFTIRISDHKGNARNIIIKGVKTDEGYSIVLETPNSPTSEFKKTTWANVHEYVYDNPTKERMTDIAKSIFGLLDSGEYVDVGKAKLYDISPKAKQQKANSPVFVSNAMKAVEGIKQEKATPEQWLAMITKAGGLKAGEDKWMGLSDWLKEQKGSVTKQEVMDFIRQNQIQIEEVNYAEVPTSSGGRESLTADEVPEAMRQPMAALNNRFKELVKEKRENTPDLWKARNEAYNTLSEEYGEDFEVAFGIRGGELVIRHAGQLQNAGSILGVEVSDKNINPTRLKYTTEGLDNKKEIALVVPTVESWNRSDNIHFGDAGNGRAVAWVRFGETTDKDGKKILVIDEIQSKRHQDGREKGYKRKNPISKEEANRQFNEFYFNVKEKYGNKPFAEWSLEDRNEYQRLDRQRTGMMSLNDNALVPDAPFDKNWHELAMKRMLRYAAENGYDKVAWTKGKQQAERYNIGTVVRAIDAGIDQEGNRVMLIHLNQGGTADITYDENGNITHINNIGKDAGLGEAKNISEIVGKEIAAGALSVQGKGTENMKSWKGDGLRIGGEGMKGFYDQMLPRFMDKYGKKWGVKTGEVELPNVEEAGRKMWSVDVTPEMKESVMQGQPMFFKTPEGHAYGFTYKGKIYVDPRIATAETPIHEYGHLWAEMKRQTSPKEWDAIKEALLNDKVIDPFIEKVRSEYPELLGEGREDDFIEEVLTQFSGKHGAERLRRMAEEIKAELGGDATAETIAQAAIRRVKSVLNDFWKSVCDMMGWKYTNAEDVADTILRDMLNGVNPNDVIAKARGGRETVDVQKQQKVQMTKDAFGNAAKDLNDKGISINSKDLLDEYGLSSLTLSKSGNHVTLSKIVASEQGKGNGTRFMEDLAKLADENGWTLALTPDTSFGGTSVSRLKDFYKRFGFRDNKGRNTDFETRESMVRRPQEQLSFQKVSNDDIAHVELNVATARDKESRDYMKKVMEDQGMTEQESNDIMGILDNVSDEVMELAEKYPAFKKWQETGIVDKVDPEAYDAMWRMMDKRLGLIPNRSAFKKNGDYPLNIDLGALCTKREAMDALMQIIVDEGGAQNLGPTQIEALKDLLKAEGFLTACDICFVETKRARAINDANKFAYEWESVLEGLGIKDDVEAGQRDSLTEEQMAILAEMTGKDYEKAFKKYISKERMRTKKGKADLDAGITASKMKMIADLISEDYSLAGKFNPEWLLTTRGTDWLFRTYGPHTSMGSVLAAMFGTATAKPLEGFNIYDALSWKKDFDQNRNKKGYSEKEIYDIGGVRAQSFTDFNPILFLDYVQMFSDLAVRRLPMHMYTKVPSLVKLFGETGTMINMSLVPAMEKGVDKAHAGLKPDGKGGWDYAWADESFPVEEAMELRQRKEFGGRVGTIAVGVSDEHIRKMLDDERIDMIIPYHKSGMPVAVQVKTGLKDATDYTDVQNTQGAPKGDHFNYNEKLQELGDPRKAAQAYLDWCDEHGYTPKFPQFRDHKNYYKLLEDFRGYDGEGNPVIQGPVRLKLTGDWKEQLDTALADRGDADRRIGEMKQNKQLMDKAHKLLQYQRLDGEVRKVMMDRLGAVLGKKNVSSLRQEEFFDALESAYAETMGDAEAHAKVEVLRSSDGRVYGFAHNGKVTFNENLFNANTPAHEFTHVWVKVARKANPKRWAEGKDLLKESKEWQEVMDDPLYKDIRDDEDAVASEALSRIVGKLNEDFVRRLLDPSQKQLKEAKLYSKILDWLRDFFKGVRSVFTKGGRELTFDEFIRMPMKDLWDEKSSAKFREAVESLRDEESAGMVDTDAEMHIVTDKDEIERLDREPTEKGYRNVVMNEDGTLGSPMGSKLGRKGVGRRATSMFEFGKWERSDENPDLANEDGKIDLIKPDGKPVGGVDYNPYIHIRPDKVNRQFKQAWERPNLIYVETEYPASELKGEYQAEKAAKPVGKHKWGTQGESLILSRWDKPVRMVPWEEVADDWVKAFEGRGVEFDIVPPKLLPILAERGVEILPPHKGMGKACNDAYKEWKQKDDAESLKQKQFEIVQRENPMRDDYHTGIRNVSDIKTFEEAYLDGKKEAEAEGWEEYASNPDVTNKLIEDARKAGKITVYSSYPIKDGTFVTPSMMQAKDYAGEGRVYSKRVPLEDVAWINLDEGQYAKVGDMKRQKDAVDRMLDEVERRNSMPKYQRVEGSPEPELTPEERQYWKKYEEDMKKWKARNGLKEDAQEPMAVPRMNAGESATDYAKRVMDYAKEKAKWKTAPHVEDYRQRRLDKDMLEEAREEEKRYPDSQRAKMRRAAAEFQQIRTRIGQQKAYDKATVKAVTDFAQDFMKMGFGDNLTNGEISRLLSSVKNATGASTVKKEVDNIMNILMDNYLRNLENRLVKLSSVKELNQTAQGVEKQGKLELKGQRMIQAFREARQGRWTAERLRERLSEIDENIDRDEEGAEMWEQEREGVEIALQYAENIEESRQEWEALNSEYKDAEKNYRASGRTYQEQQELLDGLERAMQENKMERIAMYGDIMGRLQGNIDESVQGAKEFRERERERTKLIHSIANFDTAGMDMSAFRSGQDEKGRRASLFFSPLGTFEQMLKQFGGRNAKGEGYLYDYFLRNWMDSTNKAYEGEEQAKMELDEKAQSVFGDEKVKRWSDIYKLVQNEKKMPGMEVEVIDQGERKQLHLTQGNMLYIYMANKMNDGAMKLRKMGITEEDVAKIKENLDERLVELGDWLQDEYLPAKRAKYNQVHERMFGAPMAAIDHYFPIKVLGDARQQDVDMNDAFNKNALPSTITGSIIKRKKNTLPLDILHTDALSLAIEHIEDMEQWAAMAEWKKDISTLLSYTTFRNKVKNMKTIYGSGNELWRNFFDAASIAAGEYQPKRGDADKAVTNIAKGVTSAKINFRLYTAFKQILSAPAFLHDVRLDDFIKNSVNPYGSWKWAMENMPVFRKRVNSRKAGDTRLEDTEEDWKLWKSNFMKLATRYGMSANAFVDAVTCAVGARSIYETRYKKYLKMGADEEKARQRAMQDAEIGYNLTQQSSEGAFVSKIQKDRTVAANMLSVFRNGPMAYGRQEYDAYRNLKRMLQASSEEKEDRINFMAKQLEEGLGLNSEQAQEAARKQYNRAMWHELGKLMNMAFGVTVAWNLGASLPYLLVGDDWETKEEMLKDAVLKGIAGPVEGFAGGNLISDMMSLATNKDVRNAFGESFEEGVSTARKSLSNYEINPLPLLADLDRLMGKSGGDVYEFANDLFNIWAQSNLGFNPQTFTDFWNACVDYAGDPDLHNKNGLTDAREIALFLMRVANAPTSSWKNKLIDELGADIDIDEAKRMTYDELAKRYANYKGWKDAPLTGFLRSDESREEMLKKKEEQFKKAVQERLDNLSNEEVVDMDVKRQDDAKLHEAAKKQINKRAERMSEEELKYLFDNVFLVDERKTVGKEMARRLGFDGEKDENGKKIEPTASEADYFMRTHNSGNEENKRSKKFYVTMRTWQDIAEDIDLEVIKRDAKAAGDEATAKAVDDAKEAMLNVIKQLGNNEWTKWDGTVVDEEYRWSEIRRIRREALDKLRKKQE